jgi:hypothetical protein
MGGPAAGWFIAGDTLGGGLGPNWEAVYAPGGAAVMSHDESVRLFGSTGFGLPAFARGGKTKKVAPKPINPWQWWLQNQYDDVAAFAAGLSASDREALMAGTLVIYKRGNGVLYTGRAGLGGNAVSQTAPPPPKTTTTGKGKRRKKGGGRGTSPGAHEEPEPEPASPPLPTLPPTPAPLPVTQIAGDLPAFTGTSSPFAITASQRAAMEARRLAGASADQGQTAASRISGTADSAQLLTIMKGIERQLARLNDRLTAIEETQQNPLAVYGNAYFEAGPSLSAQQDAARASATAYRFG